LEISFLAGKFLVFRELLCCMEFISWLVGWLIGLLFGWLVDLLVDWLIDWFICWLVGWLICWLIGQLASYLNIQKPKEKKKELN